MLELEIGKLEAYDEENAQFFDVPGSGKVVRFNHCLRAIAKWEEKYEIPFLRLKPEKTGEQMLDYFHMMCLDEFDTLELTQSDISAIVDYMNKDHSATTVASKDGERNNSIITSELLYGYLVKAKVPWEVQDWHFNRLMKLMAVLGELNGEKRKMTPAEIREQNRQLNAQRKKELNTKG